MSAELLQHIERPIQAGVQFLWAISLGQVLAIAIGLITFFGTLVKIGSLFLSMQKSMIAMEKRMDARDQSVNSTLEALTANIQNVEKDNREDTRELRASIHDLNKTLLSIKIIAVDLGHNSRGELDD